MTKFKTKIGQDLSSPSRWVIDSETKVKGWIPVPTRKKKPFWKILIKKVGIMIATILIGGLIFFCMPSIVVHFLGNGSVQGVIAGGLMCIVLIITLGSIRLQIEELLF